jgi:hypothetical protein
LTAPPPLVVALDMGYGHLRAAHALAEALGIEVALADRPPLAEGEELLLWAASRRLYESVSRLSQVPVAGRPLRALLDVMTDIPPLHPFRDLSAAGFQTRALARRLDKGLGEGLAARLKATGEPLLTTYFTPALAADRAGCEPVWCVVTDSDIARVWAPADPAASRIRYLAPTHRALRRLRAYGVPEANLHLTGFPLPHALLGGPELPALRRNLAARLVRLDPEGAFRGGLRRDLERDLGPLPAAEEGRPPRVAFAVGGAGAQTALGERLAAGLAPEVLEGRLRLALVAGVRAAVAERFAGAAAAAGLDDAPPGAFEVLHEPDLTAYLACFDRLLAGTDVLWTKPSELSFYAALGLPLVLSWPVGAHERYNRRWLIENGAGLKQRNLHHPGGWLAELLADGTLAAAAWSGYTRLSKHGLYRILELLGRPCPAADPEPAARAATASAAAR